METTEQRTESLVSRPTFVLLTPKLTNQQMTIKIMNQLLTHCQSQFKKLCDTFLLSATKLDMIEEAKRLKKANKAGMEKQEDLMAAAKVLQGRINSQNKVRQSSTI